MRRTLVSLFLASACATALSPQKPVAVDDQTRTMIEQLRNAIAANPADGARIYILAQYLDRTGDTNEALQWLGELDRLGWTHGVNSHDFVHSASSSAYRAIAAKLNDREPHVVRSTTAFVIRQPDLIPEGIAFDPQTGDFYVSSIYLRKIVKVGRDGTSSDFIRPGQDGILGTLGLKVDAKRRMLWAVSNAAPEMNGFSNDVEGQSAVFAYDLGTGALVTKAIIGTGDDPTLLNDLVVLDDGSVLVTDTDRGAIMRVRLGSDSIEEWIPRATFAFPNGIAVSESEPYLYVADFRGISRVDVRSRSVTALATPPGEILSGIDGMSWYKGSLIAIQNGVGRARVIRVRLDDDNIAAIDVMEAANPRFDEPTTGAIADGAFYFIANPQLRAFDENHRLWPRRRLHDVIVLRLPLD